MKLSTFDKKDLADWKICCIFTKFFQILILWGRAVVARKAHNLEAVGSNPSPATNKKIFVKVFGILKNISYLYKVIEVEAIN